MKMGASSNLGFALDQNFFGFRPEHQVQFHDQLFDLLWAGEGRWDWDTIYNLPLHIRKLWIKRINQMRDKQNSEQEQAEQRAEQLKRRKTSK